MTDMTEFPYATIIVTGADAFEFLQGQLTADLNEVPPGGTALSAWCNPKGRVICLLRIASTDEGFNLSLPRELADDVVSRLTLFRFRAKVDFAIRDAHPQDLAADAEPQAWLLGNLRSGKPEIWRAQSEKFTPHMLNLDLLGAISFDKGCYTGQEIVARTHYRGKTKRRCLRFESFAPVSPGDKISDGRRVIGEVLNAIGPDLLAVMPIDMIHRDLSVGAGSLSYVPLPYLKI